MNREKKPTMIEVTWEDIAQGARYSQTMCPVARALRRAAGEDWAVMLSTAVRGRRKVLLPAEVSNWITRFDTSDRVGLDPITFTLEL